MDSGLENRSFESILLDKVQFDSHRVGRIGGYSRSSLVSIDMQIVLVCRKLKHMDYAGSQVRAFSAGLAIRATSLLFRVIPSLISLS